jgi:hypothetical protein
MKKLLFEKFKANIVDKSTIHKITGGLQGCQLGAGGPISWCKAGESGCHRYGGDGLQCGSGRPVYL